jgi:hypothetical protein
MHPGKGKNKIKKEAGAGGTKRRPKIACNTGNPQFI